MGSFRLILTVNSQDFINKLAWNLYLSIIFCLITLSLICLKNMFMIILIFHSLSDLFLFIVALSHYFSLFLEFFNLFFLDFSFYRSREMLNESYMIYFVILLNILTFNDPMFRIYFRTCSHSIDFMKNHSMSS